MIDDIVKEQERLGLFHDHDAAETRRAIARDIAHYNWDANDDAAAYYETHVSVADHGDADAAAAADGSMDAAITEEAIADAAAHDADADADDAAAAYYITYVADYDASDAAAAIADIAAAQDGGDVYAHAHAHEAADPAAAAPAAIAGQLAAADAADAANGIPTSAEAYHLIDAMLAYLNALEDENARIAAVPFGSRGGARDGILRTCRNGR